MKVTALSLPVNMIMFALNRIAWEPTQNSSTSLLLLKNQIRSPHSTADLPPSGILTTELAVVVTITLLNAGTDPVLRTPFPAECGESLPIHAGPFSEFKQQPQAAKVSTDLVFETWATEVNNDPDMDFILDGVRLLSPDSMVSHAFSHNNKSALRPGAKNQIEVQLVKGLREDHFAIADKANLPIIINALEAVPNRDSNELRMIMDCSQPLMMNSNSYMDSKHYTFVTVDDAANLCQPGRWLAKVDSKTCRLKRWHTTRRLARYRNVVVLQRLKTPHLPL